MTVKCNILNILFLCITVPSTCSVIRCTLYYKQTLVSLCVCVQVLVKSYVELPDTDGVPDPVAVEQAWQAHKKRNNSIIIDLFHVSLVQTLLFQSRVYCFRAC